MIQWQEETEDCKADETRDAEHAVKQSGPYSDLDWGVWKKKKSGIEVRRPEKSHLL
jgi:hypothetical protein